MSEDEVKDLQLAYSFGESPFGEVIVASSSKGICYMAFADSHPSALAELERRFPMASLLQGATEMAQIAMSVFHSNQDNLPQIPLHLNCTKFQLQVWNELLKIPLGGLSSYAHIAKQIGKPGASRAVGTAIGKNPIAFLIPCHRVVRSNGEVGGYMWGSNRKSAILAWEAIQLELCER
jgi:AraC family transcriptional regulator of adaptative response/methylated-DNA-[protein]-cysteine methyltransferase